MIQPVFSQGDDSVSKTISSLEKTLADPHLFFASVLDQNPKNGFVEVAFDIDEAQLQEAARLYTHGFLTLPQEVKDAITTWSDPAKQKGRCGYKLKTGQGIDADAKELMHYNWQLRDWMDAHQVDIPDQAKLFFDAADEIYTEMNATFASMLRGFDTQIPGYSNNFFHRGQNPFFYLRFIAYKPTSEKVKLAVAHMDKGPHTLAIWESNPGLRIAPVTIAQFQEYKTLLSQDQDTAQTLAQSWNQRLRPVNHRPNTALYFLGNTVEELIPEQLHKDLAIGLHDVVQTGQPHDPSVYRVSIVGFFDPHGRTYQDSWTTCKPVKTDLKTRPYQKSA